MIILLDQDNVLADFEAGFRQAWIACHPEIPPVEEAERKSFQVREDYPSDLRPAVDAILQSRGFYRNLPLMRGARQAVTDLLAEGFDIYICTSPLTQYQNCVLEKYEWVEEYLGSEFTKRVILTRDKTLVRGDVLIDDKPVIGGISTPQWRHVLFDQPYNRHLPGPRIHWEHWREVLAQQLLQNGGTFFCSTKPPPTTVPRSAHRSRELA
jgi:5'-nucleotidase